MMGFRLHQLDQGDFKTDRSLITLFRNIKLTRGTNIFSPNGHPNIIAPHQASSVRVSRLAAHGLGVYCGTWKYSVRHLTSKECLLQYD